MNAVAHLPRRAWRVLGVGLWRAWDRVSLYLPVLLMGLLALATYWLVRNTPEVPPATAAPPLRHEPDYYMTGFSVKSFDVAGRLKSEMSGAHGRHYPDTDTLEIDGFRIRSYGPNGQLTVATARRALANSDGSEVQLTGDAVVVREAGTDAHGRQTPRMEYRSEFLHAFLDTERVRTHLPVQLMRGADRFTADRMDFDNIERLLQLDGRVRGVMVPAKAAP